MTDLRLVAEQRFHDDQAADRAHTFAHAPGRLRLTDADYLDHETWIRPAFAELGALAGQPVLDFGCGHGMAAVVLARAGATVTALDLSPGYLAETQARAAANDVRVTTVQADGAELPFAAGAFAAVWGSAILHHLDLPRAARELWRVLRPGGVAVFCEPWGANPALEFARAWLPYPGKERTADERPLCRRDLRPLRAVFPCVQVRGFQVLGMVRRVWRRPLPWLDALDAAGLRRWPGLLGWCRYVVVVLRRPTA
jgi:SAM-dependent methyltransferase